MNKVWVFIGEGARLPSGVFTDDTLAREWIHKHRLTGLLTAYPLDKGVFEWAIERGVFAPSKLHHETSSFVAGFSSAYLEHVHFESGADAALE